MTEGQFSWWGLAQAAGIILFWVIGHRVEDWIGRRHKAKQRAERNGAQEHKH